MSLRGRLLLAIGYVLLIALVAFVVPLAINTSNRVDSEVRAQATAQADLLSVAAAEELPEGADAIDPLVDVAAKAVRGRVIVVDEQGRLVSDSAGEKAGTDFSNRPEIQSALGGQSFQGERESTTLGMDLTATSAPMIAGNRVVGAVRITQSTEAESQAVLDSVGGLAVIAAIVLGIGLIAALIVARELTAPLKAMTESAERIAAGDLSERVPPSGSSEQRTLARAFNLMTGKLEEALQSQRQFVADASHQLRTPITGLRLRLEEAREALAGGGRPEPDDAVTEIDAATGEVDRLSDVVSEMLTLSKIGEHRGAPEDLGTGDLVTTAIRRWSAEAGASSIGLSRLLSHPGTVRIAGADAERALDALIENAIRYSPAGSSIELRALPYSIEVIDQGPGIPEDEREEVFERFHRGSAGRAGPRGTGLGLAIARALLRAWDGDVTIEDAPGGGTRARLRFPDPREPALAAGASAAGEGEA